MMIADFYGRVLMEPTIIEHDRFAFEAALQRVRDTLTRYGIKDQIAIAGHQHLTIADNGETGTVLFGGGIVQLDHLAGDFDQVHRAKRPLSRLGLNLRNPGE